MRQRLVILATVLFLLPVLGNPAAARYSSIVIDAETGKVVHAVNPDSRKHPASLTKMMTLYMIFEAVDAGKLKLNQKLKVSRVAQRRSPSKLGLKRGQRIRVKDIIASLVTKSANDAATVAAEAIGGTERKFARMMTRKAKSLGMTKTVFKNASGLPHYKQVSTARDMAKLSRALIRHFPHFYLQFSRQSFTYKGRTYRNHNRLLGRYDGLDGIKTGYIRASGFNLAASAERDGRRVIGVVFGGKSPRWRDRHMSRLMDRAFAALGPRPVLNIAKAPVPKPKPDAVATASVAAAGDAEAELAREWAVQVGAYQRYAPAHIAVTRAKSAVPGLVTSRITVVPDEGEAGRVYRARLVGLSEAHARRSCAQLREKRISCIVVPSDASLAQGSQ